MKLSRSIKVAAVASAMIISATATSFAAVSITAGGSSFAAPLINSCKVAWQSKTGNTLTYTTSSSGTAQTNQENGVGDFNMSDSTYTSKSATTLHIPVVMAPIGVGYNLPTAGGLYLSTKTLSDIFAGKVTKWNDAEIAADNNGTTTVYKYKTDKNGTPVKDASGQPVVASKHTVTKHTTLPNQTIKLVVRADSSGTTKNFVTLFHKLYAADWSKTDDWKTFLNDFPGDSNAIANLGRIQAVSGSAQVAATLAKTPYSIGYFETSYATGALRNASIQNANGDYVAPSSEATAAFVGSATATADGKLTFNYATKTPGAYVYGIVSYALVDSAATGDKAAAAKDFLKYVLSPACPTTDVNLGFATISGALLDLDNKLIASLKA